MKYSIITVNYNDCEGLCRTLKSVASQTFHDFELIVIDGGSSDGSVSVINNYSYCIAYWVSEKDRGIYHAMNKGIMQAHGDYCIFMNSGDSFFDNNVLERASKELVDVDILVGRVDVGEHREMISPFPNRNISLYYLCYESIPHQGSFIRTDMLKHYLYDESLKIVADWKFFLQTIVFDNCSIRFVDLMVAHYDLGGISSRNIDELLAEKKLVLDSMFPSRVLEDCIFMKESECLTRTLSSQLKGHYTVDRVLFFIGKLLLKFVPRNV